MFVISPTRKFTGKVMPGVGSRRDTRSGLLGDFGEKVLCP